MMLDTYLRLLYLQQMCRHRQAYYTYPGTGGDGYADHNSFLQRTANPAIWYQKIRLCMPDGYKLGEYSWNHGTRAGLGLDQTIGWTTSDLGSDKNFGSRTVISEPTLLWLDDSPGLEHWLDFQLQLLCLVLGGWLGQARSHFSALVAWIIWS